MDIVNYLRKTHLCGRELILVGKGVKIGEVKINRWIEFGGEIGKILATWGFPLNREKPDSRDKN